ncbi:MAG: sarcosine oxidase subunit alpha family protein [Gammaproteobacteria bacterium]|nr:sarcosine oxidase subunit alpha family protein [Gammaproteobacteria bacterium]
MNQKNRLTTGGEVDRSQKLNFTFDGKTYSGFAGDTLASALLANGVSLVGRSFKYHRPRGIMAAGVEEPNALVEIGEGAYHEPNQQATTVPLHEGLVARSQHRWPSLAFDVGVVSDKLSRLFPAGFYYKTFMWPVRGWRFYEYFIRKAAGLGACPDQPDPDTYDQRFAHFDVLVVGGGAAGLEAAVQAARNGARVCLAEQSDKPGGQLLHHPDQAIDGLAAAVWIERTLEELTALDNVTILRYTTVAGNYGHNYLTAIQHLRAAVSSRLQKHHPRQRLWKIRTKQIIFATGAHERPLMFGNNDRPGVMLADSVSTYINRYGVLPGRCILIFTNNDSAYRLAVYAARAGAEVRVTDSRDGSDGHWVDQARAAGIRIDFGKAVVNTTGRRKVTGAKVMSISSDGRTVDGTAETISCDLIAISGGWSPVIHLHAQGRGALTYDDNTGAFVAAGESGVSGEASSICVGAARGCLDFRVSLEQAARAGAAAALKAGFGKGEATRISVAEAMETGAYSPLWLVPAPKGSREGYRKYFHEFQNDSTVADIQLAMREGFDSVEHLKRYTTTGMATDQGKTSNVNALGIVALHSGQDMKEMAPTTYRPPFTPVTLGTIAGRQHGALFSPERKTPMHDWHLEHGAVFEKVGDWLRPWWYLKPGEDEQAAVVRECMAVRNDVGMMDASTLGKIDVRGPDAAEFLNRVYTNAWLKLAVGKCRYGLMLNEQGYVFDDGVTTRIGENHFHMTTTSGGAPRVMTWLEDWLQTEWTDLDVHLTSVSEQWAVISLSGPKARDLLANLVDFDISREALPFMSMKAGTMAGVPVRIFRIGFTGESSFEINVASRHGLHIWKTLAKAGDDYGLTPYGTETTHILRAERGFIIVGQDTDGTTTPMDLGMDWIVSKTKGDFLGRSAFSLPVIAEQTRKHLVGLLPKEKAKLLPQGAHVTMKRNQPFPCSTLGYVTSSYDSPILGRSIAMGLIENGRDLIGQSIFARNLDGSSIEMKVCQPVFYDKTGEKSHA